MLLWGLQDAVNLSSRVVHVAVGLKHVRKLAETRPDPGSRICPVGWGSLVHVPVRRGVLSGAIWRYLALSDYLVLSNFIW